MSRVYPTRQCATPGCDRPLVWRSPHPVCPTWRDSLARMGLTEIETPADPTEQEQKST